MATQIQAGTAKHFKVVWRDALGNVTTIDTKAPAVVTVSDPAKGTIENLSADGQEGDFRAAETGTAQVSIDGDADMSDGERRVIALGDVEVVPGEAVVGNVEFS